MCLTKTFSRVIFFVIGFVHVSIYAQSVHEVKWSENYTWQQIKDKAKNENKYIFLDCFTTWCGPCKRMDQQVYTNDTVAQFLGEKYIPVKVQMDRTDKDAQQIKQWYATADNIALQFKVNAYPTFLFLSPDGKLVGKETGFKEVTDFVKLLQTMLEPGRKYVSPYARYDSLVFEYRRGNKQYDQLPYIIKMAKQIGEKGFADTLSEDYYAYLMNLPASKIYTKANVEFLAFNIKNKTDKMFSIFYPDGKKVDAIMKQKGYAQQVVDGVIKKELVYPFLGNLEKSVNPRWDSLYRNVKSQYNTSLAEFAVLAGKVRWYEYLFYGGNNFYREPFLRHFVLQVKKYGIDRVNKSLFAPDGVRHQEAMDLTLNAVAWNIFLYSVEKDQINEATKWMKVVADSSKSYNPGWEMTTKDTYANLLYKSNRIKEAIKLESELVNYARKNNNEAALNEYQTNLSKMQAGKPTWK